MLPHDSPTETPRHPEPAWTPTELVRPRRRTVLLGAAGVLAGATGLASLAEVASASPARARRAATARVPSSGAPTRPAAASATSHAPARPHPSPPVWARRWHSPISSIADFEQRSRTPAYSRRAIMLTVDDGPSAEWTPRYLRLFAKHGITATFCMIGSQIGADRALVRDVVEHGHVVANHTWTHDEQLASRPASRIRSEIERTSAAIHSASGFVPSQFRMPGGCWGPAIYAELVRQRLMPLGWDVDPRDWALPGTAEIESAMLAAEPHDIILCHDGGGDRSETYHALQAVIPALLQRGYRFVTLPAPQPAP